MPQPEIRAVADAGALSRAAADFVAAAAGSAIAARGRFTLALSGGNTPRALYSLLAAQYADRIDWASTRLYFGDERCVPPDNADSNYRMADEALLSHITGLRDHTARIEGERPPPEAASRYDALLRRDFPSLSSGTFDVALLGIGDDGHTASLFPGSPALDETARWAVTAMAPPEMTTRQRVTLTYPVFDNARAVVFLCAGAGKRAILSTIMAEAGGKATAAHPAARVTAREQLIYLADRAALSQD